VVIGWAGLWWPRPFFLDIYKYSVILCTMKIKFTDNISLTVNDYNSGDEYQLKIKKGDVKEVDGIVDNTIGYKDIHFARKEVAECVHESVFVILG
jgi:elongation factor P hydroxylase